MSIDKKLAGRPGMEQGISSLLKNGISGFSSRDAEIGAPAGISSSQVFLLFLAAGESRLRLESHISDGVCLVHVQFRKADFSALLEELDAQPVGGDRVKRPHAFDKSIARKLEHAQYFRFIRVHGFLSIADAGSRGPQGAPVNRNPLAAFVGFND